MLSEQYKYKGEKYTEATYNELVIFSSFHLG